MPKRRLSTLMLVLVALGTGWLGGCGRIQGDPPTPAKERVTITGTVTDERGHPLPGVLVVPEPADKQSGPIPEIAKYTDAQGKYSWTVPIGNYRFVFRKHGYATQTHFIRALPGKGPLRLNAQMKKE